MSESILYYPTINIQDGAWLRSAALYWDEVCSIVPDENYVDISPELLYMQRRGCYRPIYPKDIFLLGNSHEFSEAVEHYLLHVPRPHGYHSSTLHTSKLHHNRKRIYSHGLAELIHYKKIPSEAIGFFTNSGIATVHGDWLEMDEVYVDRYMKLLAEFVIKCDRNDMVLSSDKAQSIREMYPKPVWRRAEYKAVSLTLEKCLPIPAEDISFEQLLDFKEDRREELLSLQLKITELESKISKAENVQEVKREIITFRKSWELELARSEKMFKDHGIPFMLGSLRSFIQDAGAVASLVDLVPNMPVTAMGAAVGANGLVGVGTYAMNYRNRIRTETEASGFAYIISANKAGLLPNAKKEIEVF